MTDQASQASPLGLDAAVEAVLQPLLTHWLDALNLSDAFANPLAHQGSAAFAPQFAHQVGLDLNDQPAVHAALAAQIATYLQAHPSALSEAQQAHLGTRLHAEVFGLSILEPFMHDPQVNEIMVNGPTQIFIERRGKLEPGGVSFASTEHLLRVIHRLLLPLGEQVNQRSPRSAGRMADGSHLSVIIPPLALNGPCLTIRKAHLDRLTSADLIRFGALTAEMVELLTACIQARLNLIVAGGAGSGKMTLLNILTGFIPSDERIVTVEEVAEIHVRHAHVVSLQSRLPDSTGEGGVNMRDLLRTAAQMRPERVIIGELQGPEVFEWLQLIRRGHAGSMATMHATSPTQALEQLEMLIKFDQPHFPVAYLRAFMGLAVDLIVQQTRLPDGQRKVTHITEVVASREHGYALRDLFVFKASGTDARGKRTGQYVQVNPISPERRERFTQMQGFLPPSVQAMLVDPSEPNVAP